MINSMNFETCKKIQILIENNPGLYLSKIAELLDITIQDLERYLIYLEENDKIYSNIEEGYRRYYIKRRSDKFRDKKTQETRQQIYDIIKKHPGLYLSRIAELLKMRISLAEYHLTILEKEKKINTVKDGKYYRRYYISGSEIGEEEKNTLILIRKKIPQKIITLLLKNKTMRHKELLKHIDASSSTLSYHLTILEKNGIIEVNTFGEEKGYRLCNKNFIIKLLLKYELHEIVDGFKDIWQGLDY